jgi:hypothetical protein
MKATLNRIIGILILGIIVLLLLNNFFGNGKENERLHQELIGQKERYEQLSERAAKLENQYVGQEKLRAELERQFSEEKAALTGRIKILSNATYLIREKARKSSKSDLVYQGKRIKYVLNEIRYNDGPPVGYVLIFDDGRVVSRLYNHKLEVKTAVSRNESSGRYSIISRADFVLRSPSLNLNGEKNWFGKPYPLKIVGGTALIDPTEPNALKKKFHLWAPHINANLNFKNFDQVEPGIGASLMGYGYTKNDLDYRFLQVGMQMNDRNLEATLTPVMWRPFSSLLSNTYIGPGVSHDGNSFGYFLGFHVGL